MNPVLKKMLFKGQSPVLVLNPPPEFAPTAKDFGVPVHAKPKGKYGFAVAFATSLAQAAAAAAELVPALEQPALFWLAYPKGTSKKYKNLDINRDLVNARMAQQGLEGVAMIAIDDDWSAMRFRPK